MRNIVKLDKGLQMEEIIRHYFLNSGYYVVRGAKFIFNGIDVTDIDLWIYRKTGIFNRQRFNVDIKDRASPKAFERIVWAKGLREVLCLDGAIVATTDSRRAVKDFGELQGVTILDGYFLAKLKAQFDNYTERLSDEALTNLVRGDKKDRLGEDWVNCLNAMKSKLLNSLDFDGCNSLLLDVQYIVDQIRTAPHRTEAASRIFYLSLSFVLVVTDFLTQKFMLDDKNLQVEMLNEGFRFGNAGRNGATKVMTITSQIVSSYLRNQNQSLRPIDLVKQLMRDAESLDVVVLSEFLVKCGTEKSLLDLAKSFEAIAYNYYFTPLLELPQEHRSFISVILDFLNVDRKEFFDSASHRDYSRVEDFKSSVPNTGLATDSGLDPQLPFDK
jgi:hypothetical protein